MAPHFTTLAWKIPWAAEPARLQSMWSLTVGHDWASSPSRTGEGNGNPQQCSCQENPRDGGALWAAVYGVAQSQTRLKWLSSNRQLISNNGKKKPSLLHFFCLRARYKFCPGDGCRHVREAPQKFANKSGLVCFHIFTLQFAALRSLKLLFFALSFLYKSILWWRCYVSWSSNPPL